MAAGLKMAAADNDVKYPLVLIFLKSILLVIEMHYLTKFYNFPTTFLIISMFRSILASQGTHPIPSVVVLSAL